MEKPIAQQLIADIVKCQKALDVAFETLDKCADGSEALWVRRQLSESTGSLTEIVMEISRTYPDLNPLKEIYSDKSGSGL